MNTLKNTKFAVLALAVSGLAATTAVVQAQQGVSENALRELGIMRNIFAAATQEDSRRDGYRMSAPSALYLAGQGMVFTFDLNGSGGFILNGNQIIIPPTPAPPVVNFSNGDYDFDFDFDFDYDFDFNNAGNYDADIRMQAEEYRNQVREAQETYRDAQESFRDMQREIRDLQREERNDDVDNDDKINEVEERMEAVAQELQSQATALQQIQQEYQQQRLAVFEAARIEQTAMIFSTLCNYGNTLRSLANGEHVSIVLRNYADNQTQVHVFDYADFANCSSPDSLRQTGLSYIQENRGF